MSRPMRVVICADHLGHGHPRACMIAVRSSSGLTASTNRAPRPTPTIAHHAPVAWPYQATTPANSRSICAAGRRPCSPEAHIDDTPITQTHPTTRPDQQGQARPTTPAHRRTAQPAPARYASPPSPRPPPGTTAPTPAGNYASPPTTPTTTTTPHPEDGTAPPAPAPEPEPGPDGHPGPVPRPGYAPALHRAPTPPPPSPALPAHAPAPTPPTATTHPVRASRHDP